MPKYFYKCKSCLTEFTLHHEMDYIENKCNSCESVDMLKKIPVQFSLDKKQEASQDPGVLVKSSIKEFKEELKKEKNKLSNSLWKENE